MQKETYERIFAGIRSKKNGVALLQIAGKVLTYATACLYLSVTVGSFFTIGRWPVAVLVLVPAVSFLAVTIFRKCCNAKRPYEMYGFTPLIAKDTRGKSFPSRHVFSIFVIGSTLVWVCQAAGLLVCFMGCWLAVIRVAAGVHFPRDVVAGGMIGIACGCLAGVLL